MWKECKARLVGAIGRWNRLHFFARIWYQARSTIRLGRIACEPNIGWEMSDNGKRRLTASEMATRQAYSATNNFLQAALHVFLGCRRVAQAGRSCLLCLREIASTLPRRISRQAQESGQQSTNTTFVLPRQPSNHKDGGGVKM